MCAFVYNSRHVYRNKMRIWALQNPAIISLIWYSIFIEIKYFTTVVKSREKEDILLEFICIKKYHLTSLPFLQFITCIPWMRFFLKEIIYFSKKQLINQINTANSVFEYYGFSVPDKKYLSVGMNILMEYQEKVEIRWERQMGWEAGALLARLTLNSRW